MTPLVTVFVTVVIYLLVSAFLYVHEPMQKMIPGMHTPSEPESTMLRVLTPISPDGKLRIATDDAQHLLYVREMMAMDESIEFDYEQPQPMYPEPILPVSEHTGLPFDPTWGMRLP